MPPDTRRPPGGGAPPRGRSQNCVGVGAETDLCTVAPSPAARVWARRVIRRCWPAPVPEVGTPEWRALASGDVRKLAAAVFAFDHLDAYGLVNVDTWPVLREEVSR